MKTVRRGDKYRPKNNEVVNIECRGNTYTCVCITDLGPLYKYPSSSILGRCAGCPMDGGCCQEWLTFRRPHRVIPVEDIVE